MTVHRRNTQARRKSQARRKTQAGITLIEMLVVVTIIALFVAAACAMSSYPFDPRQALSAVLIGLFVVGAVVIVKVYADMHRDSTLSHVTNTRPGELGTEFWFKIIGFGFAPLLGLLTRVFPGIGDFIFSWLQPGISSLK